MSASLIVDDPRSHASPTRVWWSVALAGAASALLLAMAMWAVPLGASEARALAGLRDLVAPGTSIWRALSQFAADGLPIVNLVLAGVPSLVLGPALWILRLPDALAVLAAGIVFATCLPPRAPRGLATLVFALSPLTWYAPVASAGIGIDMLAGLILYRALIVTRSPGLGVRLLALAAVTGLVVNGVGAYALAIGAGVLLHSGLCHGNWRVLASTRLTALALIATAALTLTPHLQQPALATFVRAFTLGPLWFDLHPVWAPLVVCCVGALVLGGLSGAALDRLGHGGRVPLVVLIAFIIAATAPMASPIGPTVIAPLVLLWAVSSLTATRLHTVTSTVLALVALAVGGLLVARLRPVDGAPWPGLDVGLGAAAAGLVVLGLVAGGLRWRAGRSGAGTITALGCGLGLACAVAIWIAHPVRWLPARVFHAQLAADMQPLAKRPIAAVSPVGAVYWRIALDRPIHHAEDLSAACRWAQNLPAASRPVLMLAPGVLTQAGEPKAFHAVLQSPGSGENSIIVTEFRPTSTDCGAGKAEQSG
ncbi:hypothetical protein [Salinisphaera sp. Q1T1-3]|uniref:hypothetical protein n=1 Tax=Salinisphaera sp. Q1T1-3 TaxID=2321229 RepID=UPI000E727DAC|nr:hypothetical protein [Salinisphaera sp. Q1T1-3]RJS93760.1 hypothetical protein D3260_06750 [Salinisphaera sp. Q1T1-3]